MRQIVKPGTTKEIVRTHNFRFQKRLGQNFLVDPQILAAIVAAAELNKNETVLEIGPGIGTLTQALAAVAGKVVAVELDRALLPILQETLAAFTNVEIIHGDALKLDLTAIVTGPDRQTGYKVVANLPYYITTPLVMKLLEDQNGPDLVVVMVQKEVAARMVARPATKDYGALSLAVQYYTQAEIVIDVPPTAFHPQPEVASAVVKLRRYPVPPVQVTDERLFFNLIKAAFQQRRKTLLNALGSLTIIERDNLQQLLHELGIDPRRRGETLSLAEFAMLANAISGK